MELLAQLLAALGRTDLLDRLAAVETVDDPVLAEIENDLLDLYDELKAGLVIPESITTDDARGVRVVCAEAVSQACAAVQGEAQIRIEAATTESDLLDALAPARPTAGPEDEEEGDEPPAEPEPEVEPVPEPEAILEPVTAAARPSLAAFRARRPVASIPDLTPTPRGVFMHNGQPVASARDADELLVAAFLNTVASAGVTAKIPVLRLDMSDDDTIGEDRRLRTGDTAGNNAKVADMVASAQDPSSWLDASGQLLPFAAAGGFCATPEPFYGQPTLGVDSEPIAEGLPSMMLDRGAITVNPAPVLSDILADQASAALTRVTSDGQQTKTVQCFVTCPTPVTTQLEGLATRLCFSNFQEMSWRERQDAYTSLTRVAAARNREQRRLAQIGALSTWISSVRVLGTARDLLAVFDEMASQERERLREPDLRFRVILESDVWARMRTDLMRGAAYTLENMSVAEATLRAMWSDRGANLTITIDGEIPIAQAGTVGGPAYTARQNMDRTYEWYMFPEGTFMVGNGNDINLGVVRDSTLNDTNRFQTFEESFTTLWRVGGWPAFKIRSNVCESGTWSGSTDLATYCDVS